MKAAVIVVVVALALFIWMVLRARTQPPEAPTRHDTSAAKNIFADLRAKYFVLKRTDVFIPAPTSPTEPWGVIMEIGYLESTVTTVAFSDGTASVLRSSGGGYFGGGDESVQSARQAFLKQAQLVQPQMTLTSDFPSPGVGHVVFYLQTDSGVYTASDQESALSNQNHQLTPLYYAGLRILHSYLQLEKQHNK